MLLCFKFCRGFSSQTKTLMVTCEFTYSTVSGLEKERINIFKIQKVQLHFMQIYS